MRSWVSRNGWTTSSGGIEWAGAPLAVIYKFHDDQGVYLAALIAFYGFLSLFPLLLLFTSILGFVLQNDAELQTANPRLDAQPVPRDRTAARRSPERARQWYRPRRQRARRRLRRPRRRPRDPARDERHLGGSPLSPPQPVPPAPTQPRADRHRWLGDDDRHGPVGSRQQRHRVRRRPRLVERRHSSWSPPSPSTPRCSSSASGSACR